MVPFHVAIRLAISHENGRSGCLLIASGFAVAVYTSSRNAWEKERKDSEATKAVSEILD